MPRSTILITGAAGFIGFHLARHLIGQGHRVVGLDSFNDYYDPALKEARIATLDAGRAPGQGDALTMVRGRVETPGLLRDLMADERPRAVVHLAAQAGVRYSIDNPRAYAEANLMGTFELLEAIRAHPPVHTLMASTSSAYGANTRMPYVETQRADHPVSFYAATKKANEGMAHSYAHLYDLPITLFRFFTVYGPWGRPDMAPMKFARAICAGQPIDVYNHGRMERDFTYVDDLVAAIARLIDVAPRRPADGIVPPGDSLSPVAPWRVVNIGNAAPVALGDFISTLETALERTATRNLMDMQPGDVRATWAETALLERLTGQVPATDLATGIGHFVAWYRAHYGV